jgi:O-antigen ligase
METAIPTGENTQQVRPLGSKLELGCVFLVLLGSWDANLPSPLSKAITVVAYGILPLLIIRRWKPCIYVATRDISLLLLVGTAIISIFWSAAPENTIDVSKGMLRSTLLGIYLAVRYSPREQMRLLLWLFGIVALLSLAVAIAIPSYGIAMTNGEPSWQGILLHKQYLGRMMALGAVLFLLTALNNQRRRWVIWAGFSLTVALILLSRSKTSLVLSVLSLLLLPTFKVVRQNYKLRVILLIITLGVSFTLISLVLANWTTLLVDILGKDESLNGRIPIWTLCIQKGLERPWLGYGYYGFWPSDAGQDIILNSWASDEALGRTDFHSHNGFLEIFLQLGWLGLSLFTLNFMSVLLRVFNLMLSTRTIESFWMFEYLTLMLLFNYTETQTFLSFSSMWSVYVSISLSTVIWQKRIRKKATTLPT